MTTKHTPGKWVACGSEDSLATWVEDCYGKRVCTMRQCEADWERAQLIASAPDLLAERNHLLQVNAELLAALSRILYAHDNKGNGALMGEAALCRHYAEMARAAIAKAEGVQS